MSADGRYITFTSYASNLVTVDANGQADVFVRDWVSGTTALISVASDGTQSDDGSGIPAISTDGRDMAFESAGSQLAADFRG